MEDFVVINGDGSVLERPLAAGPPIKEPMRVVAVRLNPDVIATAAALRPSQQDMMLAPWGTHHVTVSWLTIFRSSCGCLLDKPTTAEVHASECAKTVWCDGPTRAAVVGRQHLHAD